METILAIAKTVAESVVVGPAHIEDTTMGPLVSQRQLDHVQKMMQTGIDQGASLVVGGVGRPEGLDVGYFVKPTVFGNVTEDMTITKEEVFGPVLAVMGYESVEDAVTLVNNSIYGLAGYVWSSNSDLGLGELNSIVVEAGCNNY